MWCMKCTYVHFTDQYAVNALENNADNMSAIVSCVGKIHPTLLKSINDHLSFYAKVGDEDSNIEEQVKSTMNKL